MTYGTRTAYSNRKYDNRTQKEVDLEAEILLLKASGGQTIAKPRTDLVEAVFRSIKLMQVPGRKKGVMVPMKMKRSPSGYKESFIYEVPEARLADP